MKRKANTLTKEPVAVAKPVAVAAAPVPVVAAAVKPTPLVSKDKKHCSICLQVGHTKPKCPLNTNKGVKSSTPSKAPAAPGTGNGKDKKHCSVCFMLGHTKPTCPLNTSEKKKKPAKPEKPEVEEVYEVGAVAKKIRRTSSFRRNDSRLHGRHLTFTVPVKGCPADYVGKFMCRWPGCTNKPRDFCFKCNIPLCTNLIDGTCCNIKFHTVHVLPDEPKEGEETEEAEN